ncbi:hypothetical protein [Celeribacter litoreus]|uniref:hypothetical protein n=1 Tax=Celeribacter litoreus TaxID=2876714 RepID=UPI001CD032C8|nr:hypothetical protein [Celeribacter litoreus]MCA0043650.1 hypothetical protein [Celeribacter litoreus]
MKSLILPAALMSLTLAACAPMDKYPVSQCTTADHYPVACQDIHEGDHPQDLHGLDALMVN